jgi:3-oxoacyl-[acyl-carrier protein] reductase
MEKTALVTGAAGPLGFAISEALIKAGHLVIALDVNEQALDLAVTKLGPKAVKCVVDLTDEVAINDKLDEIIAKYGVISILVNNAGILSNNKLEATSLKEWNKVLTINLTAAFLLSKKLIKPMIAQKWGRVINITSLAAKSGGITAGLAYTVSKGGMISLTFSLAAETAASGVTVNGIAPAYVRTPMVTEQLSKEQQNDIVQKIPVKRFCEPSEVAALVAFLAGEDSGFITGEIIDQNGGLMFD